MLQLKQKLYALCREYVSGKIKELNSSIAELQDAVANETKSSAGDKYETTREMLEQEINLKALQLNEVKKLGQALDKINPANKADAVIPGSVVITQQTNYYLAISAGNLWVDGRKYYAVSMASPIGKSMAGVKAGGEFEFNGQKYVIEDIY